MTECWLCGRAMVTETHLPLDICRRASCEPERDLLNWRFARELAKDYQTIAKYATDGGIGRSSTETAHGGDSGL